MAVRAAVPVACLPLKRQYLFPIRTLEKRSHARQEVISLYTFLISNRLTSQ